MPGEKEETQETPHVKTAGLRAEFKTRDLPNTKQDNDVRTTFNKN
jgi:hypothetical protein